MPRFRQQERDAFLSETRACLLKAAEDEFASAGYDNANINRISNAAGLAKGTVYNYFESKRALMLALLDEIAQAHIGFVAAQVRAVDDPVQRLQAFFRAGFQYVEDHPAQARVMITTQYGSNLEFKERLFHLYQPMFSLVSEEILASGMQRGVFRELAPIAAASVLMSVYLGTCSQVDPQGKPYLDPLKVADFTLHGLQQ